MLRRAAYFFWGLLAGAATAAWVLRKVVEPVLISRDWWQRAAAVSGADALDVLARRVRPPHRP